MASGRERSMSIFTLLHLVFHKPVEDGRKDKKKKRGEGGGNISQRFFIHMLCKPELF